MEKGQSDCGREAFVTCEAEIDFRCFKGDGFEREGRCNGRGTISRKKSATNWGRKPVVKVQEERGR